MSIKAPMAKPLRSPVVGYNHNVRYRGRLFHVQSEDSGPVNPHVFTHLFFEGTILSSKKHRYDAEDHEDTVKLSMQQLHKAMMKELTHGNHDPRIVAFFAARGQEAFAEPPPASCAAPGAPVAVVAPETAPFHAQPSASAAAASPLAASPPAPPSAPTVIQVTGVVAGSLDSGPARRPAPSVVASPTPRPVVMVKPTSMKRPPMVFSSSADGVVVQRNVVLNVGAGGQAPSAPDPRPRIRPAAVIGDASAVSPPQSAPATSASASPSSTSNQVIASPAPARGRGAAPDKPFSDLVSDKSLDEVILEYLSDDNEPERR
jgi:hypothetical protein